MLASSDYERQESVSFCPTLNHAAPRIPAYVGGSVDMRGRSARVPWGELRMRAL